MHLRIKHGSSTHEVAVDASGTVQQVAEALQAMGILARKQRLLYKGKILPLESRLDATGLSDGASIMMFASAGSSQTQVLSMAQALRFQDVHR